MPATDERKKPQSSFVAGAGAGFVATALLHPLDLIKTRFQVQESGGRRLPLGGVNGYVGVRGKQGKKKDKYQGVTPRKQHRTVPYETPKEAAVALAHLRHDLELGVVVQRSGKKPQPPARSAAPKKVEVGVYLGLLLRPPRAGIPTVAAALLSEQEAGEAAARGVAVAYARVLA